jgi:hypothetical protein
MSTNGPPVQPYSILLLALGICYPTRLYGCMDRDGIAEPVGEYLIAECHMPKKQYITWSISLSK